MGDLEELIQYWKEAIASLTPYLQPWAILNIQQTIEALEELKKIKKGE